MGIGYKAQILCESNSTLNHGTLTKYNRAVLFHSLNYYELKKEAVFSTDNFRTSATRIISAEHVCRQGIPNENSPSVLGSPSGFEFHMIHPSSGSFYADVK